MKPRYAPAYRIYYAGKWHARVIWEFGAATELPGAHMTREEALQELTAYMAARQWSLDNMYEL